MLIDKQARLECEQGLNVPGREQRFRVIRFTAPRRVCRGFAYVSETSSACRTPVSVPCTDNRSMHNSGAGAPVHR